MSNDYIPQTPPIYQTSLAFDFNPNDPTATIANELLINGNSLSGLVCFSVDIGQPNPEYTIGTLSGTTFTVITRNVDPLDPTVSIGTFPSIHGQGAVVKITDFATIQIMRNLLNGNKGLQNLIGYASVLTPVLPTDIPDKSYVDGLVLGTLTTINVVVPGIARATITAGQSVYFDTGSNGWLLTDATNAAKSNNVLLGIAQGAGTSGNPINGGVILQGLDGNQSSLTPGSVYYLSNTPGAFSTSPGTISVVAGIAKDATHLYFVPRFNDILTTNQLNALAGDNTDIPVGSGNLFVTQTGLIHNAEKYAVDTGSSTAYAIALSPIPTSLTDGMVVYAKLVNANTSTTPTLNVNGLGAKTIVKTSGVALVVGDIAANMLCTLIYDLTNTRWVLQNPTVPANNLTSSNYTPPQSIGLNSTSTNWTAYGGSADYTGVTSANKLYIGSTGSANSGIQGVNNLAYGSLVKDANGGSSSGGQPAIPAVLGSYVYYSKYDGSNYKINRLDLNTLANDTIMTVSGYSVAGSLNMYSDGTFLYAVISSSVVKKFSVSGTTITYVSDISFTSINTTDPIWSDGTSVYQIGNSSGVIKKWPLAGGSSTSKTYYFSGLGGLSGNGAVLITGIYNNTSLLVGYNTPAGVYVTIIPYF